MTIQLDTKTINLNTVISAVGFLSTFVMVGIAWGTATSSIHDLEQWRDGHESAHRDLQTDIATRGAVMDQQIGGLRSNLAKLDQIDYRLTTVEKAAETIDGRINRITESYGNQFADMRTQLSSISTQIALTNQTLQRIEAAAPAKR